MEAIELLKIGRELLKVMSAFDLKADDWKYIAVYEEYQSLRGRGLKYTYVVTELSEKYGISESTLKRIVRRFSKGVKV